NTNDNDAGHVRIYTWNGTAWQQKGSDIDGEAAGDLSGWSVSMPDANTVAIGAIDNDGNNSNDAGHVRVYCIAATGTDVQTACDTFTWIDGNTYNSSNNTATHTIVGGAANGCDSIVTLNLTIYYTGTIDADSPCADSISIYTNTAFSPNGDNVNDVWVIDGIEDYDENIVYIYNRWGDLIQKIENYDNVNNVWDGTTKYGNESAVAGTYFYIVEANGTKALTGWVNIVK
ncbi:MAG TPA: gliding motility-associated C-terminal domain-containing protein, partial [Crocinitomix sp.]|nr:gliding motility-associated C-terminal domain-containing protein [Crocinitomix sp.]